MLNNKKNLHGKKLMLLCFFVLLGTFSLSGCWDRRELETLGLVQALGFDLKPDSNELTITTMIAIPQKLAPESSGGGNDAAVLVVSIDTPSIYEAFTRLNTTVNQEITLIQNQVLLIGEEMAKRGVQPWIDNLIRFREMRRTLLIYVCKGKAADIMQLKPKLELNPAEYLANLLQLSKRTGMFMKTNLHDFMGRYESFAQQNYAPLISQYKGQDESSESNGGKEAANTEVRIIGTAVFREDKVVGELDIYETQVLQMLTGKFRETLLTIRDPLKEGSSIIFRLISTGTPTITYQQRDFAHFRVNLNLEADLISIQSGIDYTTPQREDFLGHEISKMLKRRIDAVVLKTQDEFKSDIFGFGVKVRNKMLTSTQWDNYRWPEKYPTSKIDVKVNVKIRRVGVQFQPPRRRG